MKHVVRPTPVNQLKSIKLGINFKLKIEYFTKDNAFFYE